MIDKIYQKSVGKIYRKAIGRVFNHCCRVISFLPYHPLSIYVDATSFCNLKCDMCALYLLPKHRRGHLTFGNFKRIIRNISSHGFRLIEFPGMGEPLLNPEFLQIVRYAKERGFRTALYTNGVLINDKNVNELVGCVDHIHFSMSGAKKDTYESIHLGAKFGDIIEAISRFTRMKTALGTSNYVTINFVASKKNYNEITDMVKLTKELNANDLTINTVRKMNPEKKMGEYDAKIKCLQLIDGKTLLEQFEQGAEVSKNLGIRFSVTDRENRFQNCKWPWWGCFVTHDGYVTPCCLATYPEIINFGNVLEKDFGRIWNGKAYRYFRRSLLSGPIPHCCINCGL